MRTKNNTDDQKKQTFIEAARRAQIIERAIETIGELGYAQASLAQIAKRTNISKGVISYHFASKDALMRAVVKDVVSAFAAFVEKRLENEHTAAGILRVFIEANLAFMASHRNSLIALLDIATNARTEDGQRLVDPNAAGSDVPKLEELLKYGQSQGEFRAFDTQVMAVSIISLRNGVLAQLAMNPNLDLTTYTQELVALLELATRRTE